MSKQDVIWVEGERDLFLNMQRRMDMSLSAARKELRSVGMKIVNDAKENIRNNGSNAQGTLRKSGRVQAVEGDPDAIDAGFPMPYAAYVEYGTKGGGKRTIKSMIPRIIAWLQKKTSVAKGMKSAFASAATFSGMSTQRYLQQTAFFIARSIVKKGTKPHPYFVPAVEKNKKAVTDAISEAVRKETDRNGK